MTFPRSAVVTTPKRPGIRPEAFVDGLGVHIERLANLLPGGAAIVRLDD